jgi:hypothetical protein
MKAAIAEATAMAEANPRRDPPEDIRLERMNRAVARDRDGNLVSPGEMRIWLEGMSFSITLLTPYRRVVLAVMEPKRGTHRLRNHFSCRRNRADGPSIPRKLTTRCASIVDVLHREFLERATHDDRLPTRRVHGCESFGILTSGEGDTRGQIPLAARVSAHHDETVQFSRISRRLLVGIRIMIERLLQRAR